MFAREDRQREGRSHLAKGTLAKCSATPAVETSERDHRRNTVEVRDPSYRSTPKACSISKRPAPSRT